MSNSVGFGDLLDAHHQIWAADFIGTGGTQVLFYYAADGHWWLGNVASGQFQWTLVSESAGFGNLLDGSHRIWVGRFTGTPRTQILFYYAGDGHWWLGDILNNQLHWSLVSESAGFGNLLDPTHALWLGDFTGSGRIQVLFYYAGDGRWWLGNLMSGQLQWTAVAQNIGFGNLLDDQHGIWLGDFTGTGRIQVLFYYAGDGHWWLSELVNNQWRWSLVSQTAGFGNLLDPTHAFWLADFTGAGRTQILFYYLGDGRWWLGDLVGGQVQWTAVNQSAGFGNLLDGHHRIWITDFLGLGRAQVLFYYAGDGHWWLGTLTEHQLGWSLVNPQAPFGNPLDCRHALWIDVFTQTGRRQILVYDAETGNWWVGDLTAGQLRWSGLGTGNGFANLLDRAHHFWIVDVTGGQRAQVLFYSPGDGNWWLGDLGTGQLQWSVLGNTGRVTEEQFQYVPNSTRWISQLTSAQGQPPPATLHLTGTVLGLSVEHQAKLWFFFGDNDPFQPVAELRDADPYAWTDADPDLNNPAWPGPQLNWVHDTGDAFRRLSVPGVDPLGNFEVPTGGFSVTLAQSEAKS